MQEQNIYVAIDLKSFYASVECRERGLDPLTINLVVADSSRTEKTICLAVSPSLKQYGIPGRTRLFEVVQKVREINTNRKYNAPDHIAPPQMKKYMKYSTNIYNVYLKYFSPDDICVYSIDEVFIDVTHLKASQLATKVIHDIYKQTGITATCGVGTIVLDVGYDIEIVNYNWIHFNISISNRREVEVDMEKCKKRNMKHCTKSKFCANRSRKNT